ncbi:MAG: hypothetical protein RLY23_1545, partial [Actinomycetota bacterium]
MRIPNNGKHSVAIRERLGPQPRELHCASAYDEDMPQLLAPEGIRSEPLSKAPTISIVIAAFEAAKTIGATIRSVIAQSPSPLEIVVCDDGSSDDLEGALSEFG